MVKRRTQYKRNPKLKPASRKHSQEVIEHLRRFAAWESALQNPSEQALNRIADLLARLGFEPDEHGFPDGDWPPITKTSPLVVLDGWSVTVKLMKDPDQSGHFDTLRWKADVFEVATLVWAGAIELDKGIIRERWPTVTTMDAMLLLQFCDFEEFWNRRGVGKTAADIREEWEQGTFNIFPSQLGDWLRKARGGT